MAYLQTAARAVQLVTVADKLHNLRSLTADYAEIGEPLWKRFKRGRAQTAWYYRAVIDSLKIGSLGDHPPLQELTAAQLNVLARRRHWAVQIRPAGQ